MYIQTRILFVSFAATVILAIFIIPILRKFKIGQIERDDGPESHLGKKGTPTMGGIIIAAGIIIGTIGGYIYYSKTDPEVGKRLFPLLLMVRYILVMKASQLFNLLIQSTLDRSVPMVPKKLAKKAKQLFNLLIQTILANW